MEAGAWTKILGMGCLRKHGGRKEIRGKVLKQSGKKIYFFFILFFNTKSILCGV